MQSVNKIHANGSTKLSLNDRFSILQTAPPAPSHNNKGPAPIGGVRRRSRSRSRSNIRPTTTVSRPIVEKASVRNRTLLAQLDHKHKMRAALKIKRKSLRSNMPVAVVRQRGANVISANRGRATLQRNSLLAAAAGRRARNIATMQADLLRPRGSATARRRRSASAQRNGGTLAGRLGVNPNAQTVGGLQHRRRLNRANIAQYQQLPQQLSALNTRSRSLVRSNSQARLLQAATRSNSRGRAQPLPPQSVQQQRRGRSVSRGGRAAAAIAQTTQGRAPQRSVSRGRRAALVAATRRGGVAAAPKPISARLGVNRQKVAGGGALRSRALAGTGATGAGVARGRVQKRRASIAGRGAAGQQKKVAAALSKPNLARSRTRSVQRQPANANARGRSQSRGAQQSQPRQRGGQGKLPNNKNVSKQNRSNGGGNKGAAGAASSGQNKNNKAVLARGRSRTRGRGPAAGGAKTAQTPKTREQLDKELDQYMVNTKPYGDLDALMI